MRLRGLVVALTVSWLVLAVLLPMLDLPILAYASPDADYCLYFDGNDYVEVADDASLNFSTSDFTFSYWVKLVSPTSYQDLVTKLDSSDWNNYLCSAHYGYGKLDAYIGNATDWAEVATSTTYDDDEWHNAVYFRESGNFTLYVDNVYIGSDGGTGIDGDSSQPMIIGANNADWSYNYTGYFDEFRVYDRAVNTTEIAYSYNHRRGILNDTGLVLWHDYDEGTGTNANDKSGTGNDGSITGGAWSYSSYINSISQDSPTNNANLTQYTVDFYYTTTFDDNPKNACLRIFDRYDELFTTIWNTTALQNGTSVNYGSYTFAQEVYEYSWDCIYYNDADDSFQSSGNYTLNVDLVPSYRNARQNATVVDQDGTLNLYAEGYDYRGLDWAVLSTNETGTWKNYTDYNTVLYGACSNPLTVYNATTELEVFFSGIDIDDYTSSDLNLYAYNASSQDFVKNGTNEHFADNGMSHPLPDLQNPTAWYRNSRTYVVWQGESLDPYIAYYNHSTGAWSNKVQVGTNPLSEDSHGGPSMCIDSSGYIHVFYGCHIGKVQYAKSTNPEDISAWTDKGDIDEADNATYPQAQVIGSTIYLFYRKHPSVPDFCYTKSTDGGDNWTSPAIIINNRRYIKIGDYDSVNHQLHMVWSKGTDPRADVYYAYFNTTDEHLYNITGSDLGTDISQSEGDNYCLVYDSGSNWCWGQTVRLLDSAPYIIFYEKTGASHQWKWTYWTGSDWASISNIGTAKCAHGSDVGDFIIRASNDIEAYLPIDDSYYDRGGDIERWHYNGSSWSKDQTMTDARLPGARYYDSPQDMNDAADTWTWSNFTWTNSSIPVGTQVQWRIYYNDTIGNINTTDIQSFIIIDTPSIGEFSAPSTVYGDEWFSLTVRINDAEGVSDFVNATVELTGDLIFLWDASTDTFSKHQDLQRHGDLMASASEKTTINSTSYELKWVILFFDDYPEGTKHVIGTNTLVYDSHDASGTDSQTALFNFVATPEMPHGPPPSTPPDIPPTKPPVTPPKGPPSKTPPVTPPPFQIQTEHVIIGIVALGGAALYLSYKRKKTAPELWSLQRRRRGPRRPKPRKVKEPKWPQKKSRRRRWKKEKEWE